MDRIDAMQAFVAVADLQGFAPAARKLGLSPSAVTRLIAALEDRLGARLLQRTTRKVALTDVGARYLERARRILADVEEAEGAAEGERIRPSGRLVVESWREGHRFERVAVSRTDYDRFHPGDFVVVRVGGGLVGIPWVAGVDRE